MGSGWLVIPAQIQAIALESVAVNRAWGKGRMPDIPLPPAEKSPALMQPELLELAPRLLARLGHGHQLPGVPGMVRFDVLTGRSDIKHTLLRLLLLLLSFVLPMFEWCIFHLVSDSG